MTPARARRICCCALAALPKRARAGRRVAVRADAGYFAGELARVAHLEGVFFAIGAKRIAPLWLLLGGLGEDDWADAIDMDGAQVAVAGYRPEWWPAATDCLIRRVRLTPSRSRPIPVRGAAGPCTPTSVHADPRTGRGKTRSTPTVSS
jgi:hypothetical protein